MVYYGDEIGIKHNFEVRKDGGGIRTGARTPMQWNNEKNRGFSISDTTYLPTNSDEGIDVESQEKDKNSLLNTFKELVKIKKEFSFLNANANIEFIEKKYPLVYRRKDKTGSAIIIINPSDKCYIRKFKYNKILASHNIYFHNDNIEIKGQGYAILYE